MKSGRKQIIRKLIQAPTKEQQKVTATILFVRRLKLFKCDDRIIWGKGWH